MCRTAAWSLLSVSLLLVISQGSGNLFIGCFRDERNPRALPVLADNQGPMSLAKCSDLCTQRKYMFFGVQSSKECYCGNGYGRYEQRPVGECGMRCTGANQERCGDHWRNSIYTTDHVSGMHYLGCFAEGPHHNNRDLSVYVEGNKGTMSVSRCFEICKSRGLFYFGVQLADHCFCGNSYGRHGARPEAECNMRCKGDDTAVCGGRAVNNIYSTGVNQLPPHRPSRLRIRDSMSEQIRAMFLPIPAGVVCAHCLLTSLQHRNVGHISETFKLAELGAKLARFPAEAQEKLKILQTGKEAKTTFESSTIRIGTDEATRSTFYGMAERVQDAINVGLVKADVFGKLVRKLNMFERQTCWRHWLFWVKCENRSIQEVRGYHGHEIRQIEAALMSETLKQFYGKMSSITV